MKPASQQEENKLATDLEELERSFPGADLTTLSSVGANEMLRIMRALKQLELNVEIVFASLLTYSVAFQRWVEVSREVNNLEQAYAVGSNSFMQTHPAIQNQQRYFVIIRGATKQLLDDVTRLIGDSDEGGVDELEKQLQGGSHKGKPKRGKDA